MRGPGTSEFVRTDARAIAFPGANLCCVCRMVQSFPVRTQQWEADVGGTRTDFLSTLYTDRFMVVATQLGALGTIQSAR